MDGKFFELRWMGIADLFCATKSPLSCSQKPMKREKKIVAFKSRPVYVGLLLPILIYGLWPNHIMMCGPAHVAQSLQRLSLWA